MSCLAVTTWQLGEVERARELIDEANRRANKNSAMHRRWLIRSSGNPTSKSSRGDAAAALCAAEALEALSREHGMPFWASTAELHLGWARRSSP